jgi:hypothetical protein
VVLVTKRHKLMQLQELLIQVQAAARIMKHQQVQLARAVVLVDQALSL